jgi:hypothetical protein
MWVNLPFKCGAGIRTAQLISCRRTDPTSFNPAPNLLQRLVHLWIVLPHLRADERIKVVRAEMRLAWLRVLPEANRRAAMLPSIGRFTLTCTDAGKSSYFFSIFRSTVCRMPPLR